LTRKKDLESQRHEKKTVLLYTIPGIIFTLVNVTLAKNVTNIFFELVPSSLYTLLLMLQLSSSGFGALIGGIISDFIGRRITLGTSLTLYGLSIILSGFGQIIDILFFAYIINGLTWGILWAFYGFVLWGDLGNKENVVKMYSLGLIIFYSIMSIGFLVEPQLSELPLVTNSLLGCLLVFLSNIPVILAQELLPKGFLEKIKLRLFVNTLRKIKK
jgi:MFS family permease